MQVKLPVVADHTARNSERTGGSPRYALPLGEITMAVFALKNQTIGPLRLRGKILLLFGLNAFLLFAAAAVGFWEFNASMQEFEAVRLSQNNAIAVEATESDFKKQVQEWKDTLLRGKKPEALNKHWSNFQERENAVRAEAEQLSRTVSDPEAAQLMAQFISAHKSMGEAYRRGFQQFKDHAFDSAAGDAAVAGIDRAPTELLTKVKDRLVKQASIRALEAKDGAQRAIIASVGLFLAVTAIGLVVFLIAIQRSISNPLVRLTATMQAFAAGNFEVALFGLGRKDEIGDIANTALVFKENGLAKIRMEQEQKEAERRAVAEREAAMQTMAAEFEAAVGGIVQAAVAGDFSQRVDLNGKSGMVLNVGTAINLLCANVATALDDLIRMLNSLAAGNLADRITAQYQGNFAILKDNANKTAERIGATIAEIKASAQEVTNASAEISTSTTDLSQRTEEQAASLEQTSASMEEISATVKMNAENAQAANSSANTTREVADRGGQVVAKAVDAMAKIEDSSRKISDIIGVIDEIARQTNLLALNAAVEAARAGEAGRGFAVVASEVRSLAQRSSQAAKDIKDLITNSNEQVKDGVDLVNRAGTALTEIVESIKKVAEIVADIASASAEQASGIEQVNKALTQMDEVTQQNSALVEQNAATSKTLEHQAKAMDERVAFFQIDGAAEAGQTRQPAETREQQRFAAAKRRPAAAPKHAPKQAAAGDRSHGRMQTALAMAVNDAPQWKEF
jgi:methyl-accepting chemotaxis protein